MKVRKFTCPFCNYVHIFTPKGKLRYKKRVTSFTCPKCGKKPTQDDYNRRKGRGPKPKGQRRRRAKKGAAERGPKIEAPPPMIDAEPIAWKTREAEYVPPWQSRRPRPGRGDYTGWQPRRAPRPAGRSLGEAAMASLGIRPSGPIPYLDVGQEKRSEEKLGNPGNREDIEAFMEKLDLHVRRLSLLEFKLDRVEKRLDEKVGELDGKLQALSALTSHIEAFIEELRRARPRIR